MRTWPFLLAACTVATDPPAGELPVPDETGAVDAPETDPPQTDTSTPRAALALGPERRCEAPTERVTAGAFLPPVVAGAWGQQPFDPERRTLFTGGGLAVSDLDGDGLLDVLTPDLVDTRLWRLQPDGTFLDDSERLPTAGRDRIVAITPADVDDDGDLDLFVTRWEAPNALWRQEGGRFVDVTEAAGVAGSDTGRSASGSFYDLDHDGDLDLFVASHGGLDGVGEAPAPPSHLYRNRGDGTFDDDSALLPDEVQDGYTFIGGWHDLDDDGWADLYVVNDFGNRRPNRLMWNRQGTLTLDATSGLDVGLQGMGLGVGDLDGNGAVDVVVAGWGNNRAMIARDGQWFDQHQALGIRGDPGRRQAVGWATEIADLDHDGRLDVVEGFGAIWNQRAPARQPDEIFVQTDGGFVPVGVPWGFAHEGQTRAVLAVDVTGDGWLDLLRADLIGPATLQPARCGEAAWSIIRPRQAGRNRFAIGTRVRVLVDGQPQVRDVLAGGSSVLAAGPPEVHVGLGDAASIDRLEVRWPDGAVDVFEDVPTRRVVTITRPEP